MIYLDWHSIEEQQVVTRILARQWSSIANVHTYIEPPTSPFSPQKWWLQLHFCRTEQANPGILSSLETP